MPTKPVKKVTSKKTVTKKAAVKKTVKAAAAQESVKQAPMAEEKICKCGPDCKCAHRGSKCARFMLKLIIVLLVFALGFAAARFVDANRGFRGPRVDFYNGCLDVASVDCPKLQAVLPMMDINHDGCITHEEYRAVKKELERQMRAGDGMRDSRGAMRRGA